MCKMLKLNGINLGKRQQELNEEVIKSISQNVDFKLIKELKEQSDVDRLYKIDVASVYKNIDFIIETLKCGDSLYISRALKCAWLFKNENSLIINPDYLHHEVFPFMSIKMKKKLLTTISMYVNDEKRAEEFYKYCLTDEKLKSNAIKFLIWTSEINKMEYISSNNNVEDGKLKYFIGDSFNLAEAYLDREWSQWKNTNEKVHKLRYLIKISDEKYLDLMENYTDVENRPESIPKLGLRFSKHVITKHKDRVLNDVVLYFIKLNLDIIAKHSSVEDVKECAVHLLPDTVQEYWSMNFYECYKKVFDVLPENEVYMFLREIFMDEYENEKFEMSKEFYDLKYYELLTYNEREIWALEHLKQNTELLGPDNNYLWYQFVNYDLAIKEIKKYIAVCTDPHKRAALVIVLIDSVKNEEELLMLLRYYYNRHVNENEDNKMSFIDNLIDKKNVFKFGENCWDALNKIFYSTKSFSVQYSAKHKRFITTFSLATHKYKTLSMLYHIIHEKEIPNGLEEYVIRYSNAVNIYYYKGNLKKNLTEAQLMLIYEKFISLCTYNLTQSQTYFVDEREIIEVALLIMQTFDKTKDDCSDIILKYMQLDYEDKYKNHEFIKRETITEGKLLRLLKQDSKLLLDILPDLSDCLGRIRMNNLFKKVKVYFGTDVANDWISYCESLLLQKSADDTATLKAIVVAMFHLGSDDYKVAFVSKYVPEEAKISHDTIDRKLLTLQAGICNFMHLSRPSMTLNCILQYIKGDYVRYCLPKFNSWLYNLPMPQCVDFVTAILNSPVSIQKHGLRLALQCFSIDDLTNLIVTVWKNTKDVSLRMIIYKGICVKIETADENSQRKLYEVLKMITLDLNENDDDVLFNLMAKFQLSLFKLDFIKTAWKTVQNLSEQKSKNIQRKCAIVQKIHSEIATIDNDFCRTQILEEFVRLALTDESIGKLSQNNDDMKNLINEKWKLTAKYVIYIDSDQLEKSLDLVHYILKRCTEMWNLVDNGIYPSRKVMFLFINKVLNYSFSKNNKAESLPVLEYIIMLLCELLPMRHLYSTYIKLKLIIITKKIIGWDVSKYDDLKPTVVANSLATEIVEFLNHLKVKKLLFTRFYNKIGSLIKYSIKTMSYGTNLKNVEALRTLVSSNLIESQLPEAQLFALYILPRESPEDCKHVWLDVISKIQNGDNEELQAYLYNFFVNIHFRTIPKCMKPHNYLSHETWKKFTCQLI